MCQLCPDREVHVVFSVQTDRQSRSSSPHSVRVCNNELLLTGRRVRPPNRCGPTGVAAVLVQHVRVLARVYRSARCMSAIFANGQRADPFLGLRRASEPWCLQLYMSPKAVDCIEYRLTPQCGRTVSKQLASSSRGGSSLPRFSRLSPYRPPLRHR